MDNGLSDGSTSTCQTRRWLPGRRGEQRNALTTPIDRGLTAPAAYTPFGGHARLDRLVKSLGSADRRTVAWACVLWTGSAAAVTALWLHGYRLPPSWALLVLGVVAAIAERQSVGVTERHQTSVSFLPLVSADPFGGVIISEWYVPPTSPTERLKVTVYIMDRALRADALKVVVFRQVATNGAWQDAQPSPDTAHKLEDSILTRARELRLATLGQNG